VTLPAAAFCCLLLSLLLLLLLHTCWYRRLCIWHVSLLQAIDAYISRMRYVPSVSTNDLIGLFWDTIIKYHMLSRWAAEATHDHSIQPRRVDWHYYHRFYALHLCCTCWCSGVAANGNWVALGRECCIIACMFVVHWVHSASQGPQGAEQTRCCAACSLASESR
jgi:hypothetical protein